MEDEILNTIEVLTARVKARNEEVNKLKKLVNELCGEAGIPLRYASIDESGAGISDIRSDQFYGLPLTAAIRNYLELRKASNLGAATVTEIYRAIKEGGYKFDTKNEENARIGVGNALRKTSSIFHRLPNAQYGLLSWYPSARAPSGASEAGPAKRGRSPASKKKSATKKKSDIKTPVMALAVRADAENTVSNREIRDAILSHPGNFQGADIEMKLKDQFPTKTFPSTKIPTVLFLLKKKGLLKVVTPRSGKTGAVFCKA